MSKDEDPMAFLNKMRNKIDAIKTISEEQSEEAAVIASARDRMDRIDALLAEPVPHESKPTKPPAGLGPQEEVEWWNKKIASLSGPVTDEAQAKERSSSSVSYKSSSKSYDRK
mmetsp:Transcript_20205/g.20307  ORF Transcript_20205/g.20307 Transcript_20205/m.20307 type:complete len:113 (+) Transcript_20205:136-474(+)|eukprot:CAMPEP_0182423296 /NCGR_PEP_ID=MMETSP1167-20130531/9255_1 /TAXON_ID=2988 /ORGANISM="Mallomonas Sp, Strain CCMP3275" /LENGTH=112 /DNA_ID=CAMNT_0024602137 /DNA_START=108 /DNA_END=446 /DNA_ORIENTATION=-